MNRPLVLLMLAALPWLAGCAGLYNAEEAGPAFRDETLSVQAASQAVTPGKSTKAEVAALLGNATVIPFDSGYEVWVYRVKEKTPGAAPGRTEFVILFAPSGIVKKTRVRPPYRPVNAA